MVKMIILDTKDVNPAMRYLEFLIEDPFLTNSSLRMELSRYLEMKISL